MYTASCEHREPYWPISDDGDHLPLVNAAYIEQIICVNSRV